MNKSVQYVVVGIVVLVVIVVGGMILFGGGNSSNSTTSNSNITTPSNGKTVTIAEVNKHNTAGDCYIAVSGKVYQVPESYIQNQHPGGAFRIEQVCGTDATSEFNGQHSRSNDAKNQLAEFYIGDLAQ